jgi:hypothetical protein
LPAVYRDRVTVAYPLCQETVTLMWNSEEDRLHATGVDRLEVEYVRVQPLDLAAAEVDLLENCEPMRGVPTDEWLSSNGVSEVRAWDSFFDETRPHDQRLLLLLGLRVHNERALGESRVSVERVAQLLHEGGVDRVRDMLDEPRNAELARWIALMLGE